MSEGAAPRFTPGLSARMALYGVQLPGRRVGRREAWRRLASVGREWFRQVTALPGDTFDRFMVGQELRVVEVKPRRVTYEVRSYEALDAGHGWGAPLPDNCFAVYEVRPRSPLGWWLS